MDFIWRIRNRRAVRGLSVFAPGHNHGFLAALRFEHNLPSLLRPRDINHWATTHKNKYTQINPIELLLAIDLFLFVFLKKKKAYEYKRFPWNRPSKKAKELFFTNHTQKNNKNNLLLDLDGFSVNCAA